MDSSTSDSPLPSFEKAEPSATFQGFTEQLVSLPTPEEKLAHGLSFMRGALAQEGAPRFREFWEVRREILPFFRENLNSIARSKLWSEYVEMTVEARRLKEILEEQSAFAIEQIDLAIQSLESDLSNFETLLEQVGDISFPKENRVLQKIDLYNQIQRELNLLNALASRLTALRKEVMKTEMRLRFKTKFLKQLSELGDQIFPKRKEFIEKVSSEFEKDIDSFVETHFREGQVVGAPYYVLREEIKALQGMAKVFSLNSAIFTQTRLKLSKCWDQIRELEKEHKKVLSEKRQAFFLQKREKEEKVRELEEAEREKFRLKRQKIGQLKEQIEVLLKEGEQMELDSFASRAEKLKGEIENLEASKPEKQQLERLYRPLKDLLAEKKEEALLNLSEDDKKALENLYLVLEQKKERRKKIKDQLEIYRKSLGTSGLDFERAMLYRELIDQEKERQEIADRGIEEIEQKIVGLESHK